MRRRPIYRLTAALFVVMSLLFSQLAIASYKARGVETMLSPRSAGSWPGYVFTNAPLSLPAIHFGLGHGDGAHAPNEFYVIESTNPKISGYDDAIKSYVAFLYDLAR